MKTIEDYLAKHLLIFFLLLFGMLTGIWYLFGMTGLICDENDHFNQILNFTKGDFRLLEISAMPGYHAVVALLFKIFGLSTLMAARMINLIFGCISVGLFYLINRQIRPDSGILRTLQFALFPLVLVYFYLVYTDILSMTMVLAMLLFYLKKQYRIAGLFGILSMLIRQNNVIWVLFVPAMDYFESFGIKLYWHNLVTTIKKTWLFFLGIGLFILFVILNKGVAIGDASSHPAFKISTGNPFFMLFCFFIFFLPMHLANIPKITGYLKSGKWPILLSLGLFLIYWFTFRNDHPYNHAGAEYFIRNFILTRFAASEARRAIFFIPLLFTFWSLIVTPLSNKSYYLFYIFTLLFIMPSWLIEQRYYMIPFVCFMLFRKDQPVMIERITVIYYIGLLCLLLPMILSGRAFL